MKESEADKGFTVLIKETLEKYEEQYILGSWEQFLRKKKKKKRFILWIASTGIAASLLIGWFGFRDVLSDPFGKGYNPTRPGISTNHPGVEKNTVTTPLIIYNMPPVSEGSGIEKKHNYIFSSQNTGTTQSRYENYTISRHKVPVRGNKADNKYYPDLISIQPVRAATGHLSVNYTIEDKTGSADGYIPMYLKPDTLLRQTVSAGNGHGKNTLRTLPDNVHTHKFRIGINISPGLTATSTSSAISYSAGINADYRLTGRFQLSTGLQVERQNVVNMDTESPAWIPQGQTRISLTDLDLPLNLKWKFIVRKSTSYYVSSGVSSVVYFNERVTQTSYTQRMAQEVVMSDGSPNVTYHLENVKVTEQSTETPKNMFDLAGRLNIIFGFEHHLTSGLSLQFEPYLKIPVSLISTRDLIFTTSGISCKISF